MNDFHRKLDAFGKKLDHKRQAYEHAHGRIPGGGPAARLKQLQQIHADLAERAIGLDEKSWAAAKFVLEAERKALSDDFSTWVALIDAQYDGQI